MFTVEFIEDNTGELAKQALDEGFHAVEVALGPEGVRALVEERNTAQARIAKLESQLLEASELPGRPIGHGVGILCVAQAVRVVLTQLAEATTCGLCGESPTERNQLFICCENCTDIGVSNVPKEVFELQRQLEAQAEAAGVA